MSFRSTGARLAEAALSLSPGALFYRLSVGAQQIGYASTTVDTLEDSLRLADVLVVDLPALGRLNRTEGSSVAILDRSLHLLELTSEVDGATLRFDTRPGSETHGQVTIISDADSQHLPIPGPDTVELPSLWPLRLAFGGGLHPGRSAAIRVLDPFSMVLRDRTLRVTAESTFVVPDSADFDSTTMAWVPVRFDTVRAYRVDAGSRDLADGVASTAWIDAQGRMVRATTPLGFTAERTAFEIAYENFRHRDTLRLVRTTTTPGPDDIVPTTLVAAGLQPPADSTSAGFRVRLGGGALDGLALEGGRQHRAGDTLIVRRETGPSLVPRYRLPDPDPGMRADLEPGLLIASQDLRVAAQARIVGAEDRDPRRVATRLAHWVATEVRRERMTGTVDAAGVLARRRGDANEHTVLFVAMARALGLPARPVAGLVRAAGTGSFYYHAWAEVYLGDWVAVDPTFDQFPADALHLRLVIGELVRPADMARLLGRLTLEPL